MLSSSNVTVMRPLCVNLASNCNWQQHWQLPLDKCTAVERLSTHAPTWITSKYASGSEWRTPGNATPKEILFHNQNSALSHNESQWERSINGYIVELHVFLCSTVVPNDRRRLHCRYCRSAKQFDSIKLCKSYHMRHTHCQITVATCNIKCLRSWLEIGF